MSAPTAAVLGAVLGGCILLAFMDRMLDLSDSAAAWVIGLTLFGSAAAGVGLLVLYYANGGTP